MKKKSLERRDTSDAKRKNGVSIWVAQCNMWESNPQWPALGSGRRNLPVEAPRVTDLGRFLHKGP